MQREETTSSLISVCCFEKNPHIIGTKEMEGKVRNGRM